MNNEIELQLLIPKAILDYNLNLSDLEFDEIEQAYFSNFKINKFLLPILKSAQKYKFENTENGRIRRKADRFFITLKSKMGEDLSRDELEEEISKEDYSNLLPEVDAGNLKKKRFYLELESYQLEIDLITELNGQKFYPEFLTIDIELKSLEDFEGIRNILKRNSWLKYTYEITGSPLYKFLGMRKLCRNGYSKEIRHETHKVIKKLIKTYQSEN